MDAITGLLAGLAIFSVLGYMSTKTGIDVPDLAVGGPGLSFIVYPEALSLMPFPWIWCIFFFMMMLTIGFGSILSLSECVLDSITEALKGKIDIHGKETFYRFLICMIFYIIAFPMTTHVKFKKNLKFNLKVILFRVACIYKIWSMVMCLDIRLLFLVF